jgi:hypothetical protein
MGSHTYRLDGFQLFSGIAAVVAGPIMLAAGSPAGWSFLVLAAGLLLLLALAVISGAIVLEDPDPLTVVACLLGMLCLGIAVVYLTRATDDLPSLFPGYNAHSDAYSLTPGIVLLAVGTVGLVRAIVSVHPHRPER